MTSSAVCSLPRFQAWLGQRGGWASNSVVDEEAKPVSAIFDVSESGLGDDAGCKLSERMTVFDLLIKGGMVVTSGQSGKVLDVAVRDGKFALIEEGIPVSDASRVIDGSGRLVFPGAVDAHQHWGIYNPLDADARSESAASAQGGVTTGITYLRTGRYYMNRSGPYREFLPDALEATDGNAFIDYGFHIAPIMKQHIGEIPEIIEDFGIPSFKIFMFYGQHGLHGRSSSQQDFLMIPDDESYDLAHFEFIMRGIEKARQDPRFKEIADAISLSLHCETAEIMTAYTKMVEEEGRLTGLEAYHESRPPHSEGLAVTIASYLAHETGLKNINLLHLSSKKALQAAMMMASTFPHIDFRREVTIGHLLADIHTASGIGGKVNPPLRPREDVESLWDYLFDGSIDWVVSDHACCRDEVKFGEPRDDIFLAKSGFGGTEYLLPGLITEGRRRGLPLQRIVQLTSSNPAKRFGLHQKGDIAIGLDADFSLVDPDSTWTVRAVDSMSTQEYTPFEGFEMTARITDTYLRGQHIYAGGEMLGDPRGEFVRRPQPRR